jgi:hypothetical protein
MHVPFLQENISLIKEQNRAPCMADVQDLLEFALQVTRIGAEFAGRDHIQRTFKKLADAFGGKGLASARRSVEDSLNCYQQHVT